MTTEFKMTLIAALFFVSQIAFADNWLCTEAASQRSGNKVSSCGIGLAATENAARLAALENAKIEFNKICEFSDDCKHQNVSIHPERTSCSKQDGAFKCYRLLVFTIGTVNEAKLSQAGAKAIKDEPKSFNPFSYSDSSNSPKVKIGMTKKKLLEAFGAPEMVKSLFIKGRSYPLLVYVGGMCDVQGPCAVAIVEDKVAHIDGFKPVYTEDLK